jgi:hypothetical protein
MVYLLLLMIGNMQKGFFKKNIHMNLFERILCFSSFDELLTSFTSTTSNVLIPFPHKKRLRVCDKKKWISSEDLSPRIIKTKVFTSSSKISNRKKNFFLRMNRSMTALI